MLCKSRLASVSKSIFYPFSRSDTSHKYDTEFHENISYGVITLHGKKHQNIPLKVTQLDAMVDVLELDQQSCRSTERMTSVGGL